MASEINFNFLQSNKVAVFPCAYRDPSKGDKSWEANLATEKNISNIGSYAGGKKSYLIGEVLSEENEIIRCCISGYYFELDFSSLEEGKTINDYKYAYIKLSDISMSAGNKQSTVLWPLKEINGNILDTQDGFIGIGFLAKPISDTSYIGLDLFSPSSKFAISEDNIEGKTRDANKAHIDSGDSIYNNFLTEKAIITDSFVADGATNVIGGANAKLEVKNGTSKQVAITAPNTDISGELHVKDINYKDGNDYTSIKLYDGSETFNKLLNITSNYSFSTGGKATALIIHKDVNSSYNFEINNTVTESNQANKSMSYIILSPNDTNTLRIGNSTNWATPYNSEIIFTEDGGINLTTTRNNKTATVGIGFDTGSGIKSIINLEADKIDINGQSGSVLNTGTINAVKTTLIDTTENNNLLQVGTTKTNIKFNVTASGDVTAQTYTANSDLRLKENIEDYIPEKSILDLPIKKFDFISGKKNNIGCIAQELQEICPEIVHEGINGYLGIEENKLVYLLLYEVKKLKEEIENLKKGN